MSKTERAEQSVDAVLRDTNTIREFRSALEITDPDIPVRQIPRVYNARNLNHYGRLQKEELERLSPSLYEFPKEGNRYLRKHLTNAINQFVRYDRFRVDMTLGQLQAQLSSIDTGLRGDFKKLFMSVFG